MSEKNEAAGTTFSSGFKFYFLVIVFFSELVALAFQNIDKKRIGMEINVLVRQKTELMKVRREYLDSNVLWEDLNQLDEVVRSASLDLVPNKYPEVRIKRND